MAEPETYYEMLWDCTVCDARGLLGVSHRHCPMCGATQDPTRRYFPLPGQEVEAKNHRYAGIDWICAYCQSPNSAAAKFCVNCGAGQDGSKPVAVMVDAASAATLAPATPSQSPPPTSPLSPMAAASLSPAHDERSGKSSIGRWLFAGVIGLIGVIALLVFLANLLFTSKPTEVEITGHAWQRSISIEHFAAVNDSAWCDSLPSGAYSVTRSREVRSHRDIAAGQDCTERRVDMGDGSFTRQKECVPRYTKEAIYDERCRFRVNRWQFARSVVANQDNFRQPAWPALGVLQGNLGNVGSVASLGAEREGSRSERYTLTLANGDKTWHCDVDEAQWQKLRDGTRVPLRVRTIFGADCSSLR
jgi:hypothetical protein